jgi:DNA-binding HxlR family transcriptional regulator
MGSMRMHNADETCGIAQAAVVLGDWWNVLVLREIARGHVRFDALAAEIGLSRNVLTERLGRLVAQGVLRRSLYQRRPVRYEYVFTDAGRALLPVLVAMQDWGDRWMLGDGSLTATTDSDSAEHTRVHALAGTRLPEDLELPGTQGIDLPVVSPERRRDRAVHLPRHGSRLGRARSPESPAAPWRTASSATPGPTSSGRALTYAASAPNSRTNKRSSPAPRRSRTPSSPTPTTNWPRPCACRPSAARADCATSA